MAVARAFQVGDWVQIEHRIAYPGHRGRVVARTAGKRMLYTVEFRPGDYPDVDGDWGQYWDSEIAPWQPTEEELATWLITRLTG